jgi:predicted ribosomally synthesized peptide with nif11-like leader
MTDNLKDFLKKANSDKELLEKLKAIGDDTDKASVINKFIEIAGEEGITLTAADFEEQEGELEEEELFAVAGGFKKCKCYVGGGGSADADGKTCACVSYGYGDSKEESKYHRCECILMGTGYDNGHTYTG